MKQIPEFISFQFALRTFLKEAFGHADGTRDFALTETPRGVARLCFGLSCIDSGFRENTVQFPFRAMSRELYDFLSGPVSGAILQHYGEDVFWLVGREPARREQTGRFELVSASEAANRLQPMCLAIFNRGHDWAYVNEDANIVYLSAEVARRVRTAAR